MSGVNWFILLLAAGATARITRLIGIDTVSETARIWLITHIPQALRLSAARLLSCPWCLSVWVAAAVIAAGEVWDYPNWWRVGAAIATASQIAGLCTPSQPVPEPALDLPEQSGSPHIADVTDVTDSL